MRSATKVLSVLATGCAMIWAASPTWASCPYSLPMLQGGIIGDSPGVILSLATHVNGFFWELGFGDPADGSGNDGNSQITGFPAFTHPDPALRWIKGAPDEPVVVFDWILPGVDNCISGGGGAIASTVLVYYIIDSNDDYAIAALQGTNTPFPHNNLDLLVTDIGPHGNDVALGPRTVTPVLANSTIVDANCLDADVLPATAGMNLYFDAGGPYAGVVDTSSLALTNGNTPESCDPVTGCHLNCISLGADLCWGGNAVAVASQVPGDSVCVGGMYDGSPCGPVADPGGFCEQFGGVCPPVPPITIPFGPPIPGGCILADGPDFDGDGVPDIADCAPDDDQAWALPSEVTDSVLSHTSGTTTLSWAAPASLGGTAVAYDTIASALADDFSGGTCIESNDGTDTMASETSTLPLGDIRNFLVRAVNTCGLGFAGTSSNPVDCRKRVFVTNQAHTGDLGGLAGADAECALHAATAALSGDYKAWLSDSTGDVASRLSQSAGAYVLVDGTLIATDWADLTDGTLQNLLNQDENGSVLEAVPVWTGTGGSGQATATHCQDWTVGVAGDFGTFGRTDFLDDQWTSHGTTNCGNSRYLYCIEQ